jgi:hypothetical protein
MGFMAAIVHLVKYNVAAGLADVFATMRVKYEVGSTFGARWLCMATAKDSNLFAHFCHHASAMARIERRLGNITVCMFLNECAG